MLRFSQTLVLDCYQTEQTVVLFLDNLDQVGYAEIGEDVRRVTDLARYLLGIDQGGLKSPGTSTHCTSARSRPRTPSTH